MRRYVVVQEGLPPHDILSEPISLATFFSPGARLELYTELDIGSLRKELKKRSLIARLHFGVSALDCGQSDIKFS